MQFIKEFLYKYSTLTDSNIDKVVGIPELITRRDLTRQQIIGQIQISKQA